MINKNEEIKKEEVRGVINEFNQDLQNADVITLIKKVKNLLEETNRLYPNEKDGLEMAEAVLNETIKEAKVMNNITTNKPDIILDLEGDEFDFSEIKIEDFKLPEVNYDELTEDDFDHNDGDIEDDFDDNDADIVEIGRIIFDAYEKISTDNVQLSEIGKKKICTVFKYIKKVFVEKFTGAEFGTVTLNKVTRCANIPVIIDCLDVTKDEIDDFIKLIQYTDGFSITLNIISEKFELDFTITDVCENCE